MRELRSGLELCFCASIWLKNEVMFWFFSFSLSSCFLSFQTERVGFKKVKGLGKWIYRVSVFLFVKEIGTYFRLRKETLFEFYILCVCVCVFVSVLFVVC